MDVTPLTLGIETVGGVMTPMIPRNTKVPYRKKKDFTTNRDNQDTVSVCIFQGERPEVKDNIRLGRFDLRGIPLKPRGEPSIDVTYDIDINGILNVVACETSTGKDAHITITNDKNRLSQDQVEKMVQDAMRYKAADDRARERQLAMGKLESFCYKMRRDFEQN